MSEDDNMELHEDGNYSGDEDGEHDQQGDQSEDLQSDIEQDEEECEPSSKTTHVLEIRQLDEKLRENLLGLTSTNQSMFTGYELFQTYVEWGLSWESP